MTDTILCVEDDSDIGRLLVSQLTAAGYQVEWVTSGEQALERWQVSSLVLLDLMLPGMDGLSVCREIRRVDAGLPLIMLTARAATHEVVRGLEMGADDYITKPFEADILLARIQALLRRRGVAPVTEDSGNAPLVCGELIIDTSQHQVTLAGKPLSLTAKEFALLSLFAHHPGRSFTRSALLDEIWGPQFDGFDHTVNTHINRLRGKIESNPAKPRYILTVWGHGYRFASDTDSCP